MQARNKLMTIMNLADKTVRHILALSGGKDSSALAVYMKDIVPVTLTLP